MDMEEQINKISKEKKPREAWWQPALIIFLKFSGWIFFPVIAAVYLGKWLDRKYNTEPYLFLATVGAAFTISMVGLIRDAKREYKKMDEIAKGEEKKEK